MEKRAMQDPSILNDEELYRMMAGRRKAAGAAFSVLYDRHAARLYAYCRHILADEEQARDVFQESFTRLYEMARQEKPVQNVPGLLLRIARNLCLNDMRKRKYCGPPLKETDAVVYDDAYDRTEFQGLVEAAIETLAPENREALLLKEYGGMSYREIADLSGVSLTAVRSRIFRAKRMLREILAPYIKDVLP